MKVKNPEKAAQYIFQIAIAAIFSYFGFLAVADPGLESAKWLSSGMYVLVTKVMPDTAFIFMLGVVQLIVAILLIIDVYSRAALLVAGFLLVGIIVNLGWGEIALRDFVILMGTLQLYFLKSQKNEGGHAENDQG